MAKVDIEAKLKVKRIAHAAMLATLPLYAAVATVIVQARDPEVTPPEVPGLAADPLSHPLFLALAAASLVVLLSTPFVRTKMMPPRSYGKERGRGNVKGALKRLQSAEIISWSLTEMVGITGFALTLLSNEPLFTYGFGGVAFLVMLAYAPSHKVMDEVVRVAQA